MFYIFIFLTQKENEIQLHVHNIGELQLYRIMARILAKKSRH